MTIAPDKLIAYLEACGGSDRFEFFDTAGGIDCLAASEFRKKMEKVLPKDCIKVSYNVVWLRLQKQEV